VSAADIGFGNQEMAPDVSSEEYQLSYNIVILTYVSICIMMCHRQVLFIAVPRAGAAALQVPSLVTSV